MGRRRLWIIVGTALAVAAAVLAIAMFGCSPTVPSVAVEVSVHAKGKVEDLCIDGKPVELDRHLRGAISLTSGGHVLTARIDGNDVRVPFEFEVRPEPYLNLIGPPYQVYWLG